MPEGFIPSAAGVVGVNSLFCAPAGRCAAEEDCGNDNEKNIFHALLF